MYICVDFDGTVVEHEYPNVGNDVPGAIETLVALQEAGHEIILWTMRCGEHLQDAIKWFESRGIKLFGIQRNPTQDEWTDSPKAYAQIYIDDAAFGCPLVYGKSRRPYVDWSGVCSAIIGEVSNGSPKG